MRSAGLWMIAVIVLAGCASHPVKVDDVLEEICRKNRLQDVYRKEKIAFTFHARLPDKTVQRAWEWHVPSGEIFLDGKPHHRSAMFVNDVYWLLFPLMARDDRGKTTVSVHPEATSPIGGLPLAEVVVRYVDGKGYTPNDAYRLYVDEGMVVREWSYLKGGKEPPVRMTTWEGYQDIDGVTLSLLREGTDGFRVWFTDVRME